MYRDPRKSKERFDEFALRWLATKVDKAPKTVADYKTQLRAERPIMRSFGKKSLSSIGREDIQAWIVELRAQGVSPATIKKAYRVLSMVFTEAEVSGLVLRTPAFKIDLPSVPKRDPRFLNPQQNPRFGQCD
jgi:site-specific recombinase XerD